jgi:hypothetical protein
MEIPPPSEMSERVSQGSVVDQVNLCTGNHYSRRVKNAARQGAGRSGLAIGHARENDSTPELRGGPTNSRSPVESPVHTGVP